MTQPSKSAREHEREARKHDPHERSPVAEDEAGEPAREETTGEEQDRAAPPGTLNQQ
jgi:hypothetical protein